VNRLDSEDKQFGYIVDYKDLFRKVENAVSVYTSELDYDHFEKKDVDVLLPDRLSKARERLDNALESLALLAKMWSRLKIPWRSSAIFVGIQKRKLI
jgi:type I restriction enzyme R subunit